MLPDETLRQETRQFTALNRSLLLATLLLAAALCRAWASIPTLPLWLGIVVGT